MSGFLVAYFFYKVHLLVPVSFLYRYKPPKPKGVAWEEPTKVPALITHDDGRGCDFYHRIGLDLMLPGDGLMLVQLWSKPILGAAKCGSSGGSGEKGRKASIDNDRYIYIYIFGADISAGKLYIYIPNIATALGFLLQTRMS